MADKVLCSIENCGKVHYARGWCGKHYMRWYTHGHPTGRAPKRETECQRYYREVVLPHTGDDCLVWPFSRGSKGYGQLRRDGKVKCVARLVCEDANGPPPLPTHEAAHECGNGHLGCCNPRHLSWKTPVENQKDRVRHGTSNRGEGSGNALLTDLVVRQIRANKERLTKDQLAARYGVSRRCIFSVVTRRSWRHI